MLYNPAHAGTGWCPTPPIDPGCIMTANTGLSEEELVELDDFLLSEACDDDALSVDEAHGFLTALIVGPKAVARDEWLVAVWGQPHFADEEQAKQMTDKLVRLYDNIEATLREGYPFEPLVVEEEEEGEIFEAYEGWCFGFMLGVEEQEEQWSPLPKDAQALLAPMGQLALLTSDEEEEEPDMDEAEYEDWVELLPGAVTGLYAFWHGNTQGAD